MEGARATVMPAVSQEYGREGAAAAAATAALLERTL